MQQTPDFLYHPFYCEENIWQLCQDARFAGGEAFVVFVSNADKSVAIWHQKLAKAHWLPVVFDYHVILLARSAFGRWEVWDLDTTLGLPHEAVDYFSRAFRPEGDIPQVYQPLFRLFPVAQFLATFSSDRSHMRDASGNWLKPPPDWNAPYRTELGMTLPDFIQMMPSDSTEAGPLSAAADGGAVLTLPRLLQRLS